MNVVVTGGGTVAPIDDVRKITNVSTGRFSAAITEACLRRGAAVWHVHAPGAQVPLRRRACFDLDADNPEREFDRLAGLRDEWRRARSRLTLLPLSDGGVDEYARVLRDALTARRINVAFLAMAVSDFEPVPFAGKIESDRGSMTIEAVRTPKVIRSVRDWAPDVYLAGFKLLSRAEPAELLRAAEAACRTNRADLTVANDLQTLRDGAHAVHLVRTGRPVETLGPGADLAERLVDRVFAFAAERGGR